MSELLPELPRNVESVLGMLAMNLSIASKDTGNAYYIDLYPIDPANPDIYTADIQIQEPKEG